MNDVQDRVDPAAPDTVEEWAAAIDETWDSFDWEPYEKSVQVDGRRINYVELGDPSKPTLLFVHGIMGTWRNWIFNLLPFCDRFRVIAIDLPGFGESEMPADQLTMENYARIIKDFSETLGLGKVSLVGNSMGGLVGSIVGKYYPEVLHKLVLVDAAGFSTANRYLRKLTKFRRVLEAFFAIGYVLRKLIAANKYLAAAFTKIVLLRPGNINSELMLVLLNGIGRKGFVDAATSISRTRIDKVPGEITTETMIVWGRQDALIPKRDAYRFAKMIPQARFEMMEDTGHIPMFETPDEFNALIEDFVCTDSGDRAELAA